MRLAFFILSLIFLLTWGGFRTVNSIQYNQDCGGHLKRAADANTTNMAKDELNTALKYLEEKGYTEGYTSVVYRTPDEDIGFWYNNLKASHDELAQIDSNTTQLEKSNVLIKLRETLLDHGDKSDSVTCPGGISIYPSNGVFFVWGWGSFILLIISGVSGLLYIERY